MSGTIISEVLQRFDAPEITKPEKLEKSAQQLPREEFDRLRE